jgi:hypothetical protein
LRGRVFKSDSINRESRPTQFQWPVDTATNTDDNADDLPDTMAPC